MLILQVLRQVHWRAILFSFLFCSLDLMTVFSVVFGFLFHFCVHYRFLVCSYHEVMV